MDVSNRSLGTENHAVKRPNDQSQVNVKFNHRCKYFIKLHIWTVVLTVYLKKNHVTVKIPKSELTHDMLSCKFFCVSFICNSIIAYTCGNPYGHGLNDVCPGSLSAMKLIYG